ncbi:MAG TPA: hypothetical protein DE045_06360 [Oceanospirillaceae bacterium]|nr:hypothetical protein [Oceanospirillaceae bacterium]
MSFRWAESFLIFYRTLGAFGTAVDLFLLNDQINYTLPQRIKIQAVIGVINSYDIIVIRAY